MIFDPLLDRLGLARASPPVFVLIALNYVVMLALAENFTLLLVFALIWGIFQHLGLNLLVARLTGLDQAQRGAIMGLYSTITYLCVFAAPFAGALLFPLWGLMGCMALSALLCLLEAIESAITLRRHPSPDPDDCVSPDAPV